MVTRTRIGLLIVAVVATSSFIFLPQFCDRSIIFRPRHRAAIATRSSSLLSEPRIRIRTLSSSTESPGLLTNTPWAILPKTTEGRRPRALNPAKPIPPWQRLLDESSPKARELFETGLAYLRIGRYVESRLAFQTLVRTYPDDKAQPLGYSALALSFCKEGGDENLLLALEDFRNYLLFFPSDPNLENLAEAAQTNIGVIWRELMSSTLTEDIKLNSARTSLQALTQFLNGYPRSQNASSAQAQLAQIEQYLASVPPKAIVVKLLNVAKQRK